MRGEKEGGIYTLCFPSGSSCQSNQVLVNRLRKANSSFSSPFSRELCASICQPQTSRQDFPSHRSVSLEEGGLLRVVSLQR